MSTSEAPNMPLPDTNEAPDFHEIKGGALLRFDAKVEPDVKLFLYEPFIRNLRHTEGSEKGLVSNPDFDPSKPSKAKEKTEGLVPIPATTGTRAILYVLHKLQVGTAEERAILEKDLEAIEKRFEAEIAGPNKVVPLDIADEIMRATEKDNNLPVIIGIHAFQEAAEDFHSDHRFSDLLARIELFTRYALRVVATEHENWDN